MYRPSYIEVDGKILENNVQNIKKNYPEYKYYFGVVKNNCYHHGFYAIKYLIKGGINYLAVSSLEEALNARKYAPEIPILCLEPIDSEYVYDAINNNITISISSLYDLSKIIDLKFSDELKVHLMVDSGMNRLGFKNSNDFYKAYSALKDKKNVIVEGVYTHLATSGIKDQHYSQQISKFLEITSMVDLNDIPIVHIDRSLTMVVHDKLPFVNGARIGITLYGFKQNIPTGNLLTRIKRSIAQRKYNISNVHLMNNLDIKFAFRVYSRVMEIRNATKGEFCGYGADYIVTEDVKIATIPVGYADGITKNFKYVFIHNVPCEIISECMDMIMVKVPNNVKIGDKVEIIGKNQSIKDLCLRTNMVGHKLLNQFSNRLPVVYKYLNDSIEVKY